MRTATFFSIFLAAAIPVQAKLADKKPSTDEEWKAFLTALAEVESNGRNNLKVLDTNGRYSYGCLQIQELYLIDSGKDCTLEDLYDRETSFAVAKAYLTRYAKSYERRTGKTATCEVLARIHNGGPKGAERSATVGYWNKVKAALGNS
jgi:hypothetical protein